MKIAHAYAMVFITIALTVYGQFVIKWQVLRAGAMPHDFESRLMYFGRLLINPWVLSALSAAFLASIAWMIAMTKLEISRAFPLTAITFICITLGGALLFKEPLTPLRILGVALLALGIIVSSQG